MEIKNYSESDLQFLRDNYLIMSVKEIAKSLNKTTGSISNAMRKLGLRKQIHNAWTDDDNAFLKEHYYDMTSEEIGNVLGRTVASVNTQRDKLGLVRHENWSNDEIQYLKDNYQFMGHKEIGNHLHRTEDAVRAKCFDLNLYKKEKPWEDWEKDFLKANYMQMSKHELAEILNRSPDAIQIKASRYGFKKYPYYCDYHYFDQIDTEEKAYWLGFLTADGWISKNKKNNAGVVGIELQYGDIGHLKKFNKSIKGNYQITDRWVACGASTDKESKTHHCCIRIFSLMMYEALSKLGFDNEKSYHVNIPDISEELIRHYLRGYFDGDGCFCLTNKSFTVGFISASKPLFDDVCRILESNTIKYHTHEYTSDYNTKMYRIYVYDKNSKLRLLDYMYQNCQIYLDRKYKKYQKAIQKHRI